MKKRIVIVLLFSWFSVSGLADIEHCPSCGQQSLDVSMAPSEYYAAVSPEINFAASVEKIRRTGYYDGFYLGTAYGVGEISYDLSVNNTTLINLQGDSKAYSALRWYGGYALVHHCYFYLAAEVGYIYRSIVKPTTYDTTSFITVVRPEDVFFSTTVAPCRVRLDLNSQHAWSVDVLPGVVFSRFLAFLRIGVEQTNYSWTRKICFANVVINESGVVFEDSISDNPFVESQKKSANGFRLGAGFAIAAGKHVSFNFNYVHVFSQSINFSPNATNLAANLPTFIVIGVVPQFVTSNFADLAGQNNIKPQRNEVYFGVTFTI